jgi:uncharacterized protein (TIGR01777 family)
MVTTSSTVNLQISMVTTMISALALLSVQGVLGALDNLWHHELSVGLPKRPNARRELVLHAVRGALYAPVFLSFGWLTWTGWLAWAFGALLVIEIGVTLLDFVEEDRSRVLPATERVLHTVLALNYGAFLALLAPELASWAAASTGVDIAERGAWAWVMTVFAAGALGWALRDAAAAWRLAQPALATWQRRPFQVHRRCDVKTILVTGGTGFIGNAVCRHLIERGHKVIVLTRDRARALDLFGPYAEAITALDDIRPSRRVEVVINLAGAPIAGHRWTPARKALLVESRVGTTRKLVEWMRRLPRAPKVLVSASAVGWYGTHASAAFTEQDSAGQDFPAVLCRGWEREAFRASASGTRVVVLRLGLVLGAGGLLARLLPVFRLGLGAPLGTGNQWMPWIDLRDVVRIVEHALGDEQWHGAINAVAPEPVTNCMLSATLASALRRPLWPALPSWPLRIALGEMSTLLLDGQNVIPERLAALGYAFRFPTLAQALAELLTRCPAGQNRASQMNHA